MAFDAGILDTRIPLAIGVGGGTRGGSAMQSMAEMQQEQEQARNATAVADYNTERARGAQAENRRQQMIEAALTEAGGDWEKAETLLAPLDPDAALKIRKGRFEAQQSYHQMFGERMKSERLSADVLGSFLNVVEKAPDLYAPMLAAMRDRLPEDVRGILPDTYDPRVIAAVKDASLSAKEAMERADKAEAALQKGDWKTSLYQHLADADDEEEYANIIASHRPFLPAGAAAVIPPWTPDAPDKIKRIVMGPDAVADNARDVTRDAVLERQGDARVAIAGKKAAQSASSGAGKSGGAAGGLVDAIMANPSLFGSMTPTEKAKLIPALQARGFKFEQAGAGGDGKPSNGAEKTALGFLNRAKQADDELQRLEGASVGTMAQAWRDNMPNFMQSSEAQVYEQAQRAFTEARLRKESGAAIAESEYTNDRRTYFRVAGDSPAVLEQKRRARASVLAGLAFQAGRALPEFYGDDAPALLNDYRARAKGGGSAPTSGAAPASGSAAPVKRFNPKTGKLETVK